MQRSEWMEEGKKLFGEEMKNWVFVCPICETKMSMLDYQKSGAPQGAIAMSCIGRYTKNTQEAFSKTKVVKGKPCNYTSGGLFDFNPIEVMVDGELIKVFDFYRKKEVIK